MASCWPGAPTLALTALAMFAAVGGAAAAPIAPFSFGWPLLAGTGGRCRRSPRCWRCALDGLLFKRLRRQGAITLVIASFGAALALRNLLLFFYGGMPQYYSQELQIAIALRAAQRVGRHAHHARPAVRARR